LAEGLDLLKKFWNLAPKRWVCTLRGVICIFVEEGTLSARVSWRNSPRFTIYHHHLLTIQDSPDFLVLLQYGNNREAFHSNLTFEGSFSEYAESSLIALYM
jgi:hypothetical protein